MPCVKQLLPLCVGAATAPAAAAGLIASTRTVAVGVGKGALRAVPTRADRRTALPLRRSRIGIASKRRSSAPPLSAWARRAKGAPFAHPTRVGLLLKHV